MSKFVKNEKGYEKSFSADWNAVKEGLKKVRGKKNASKKIPTSIALDPEFLEELKHEAHERSIPYQILMRMLLVEGFKKLKKAT